MSTIKDRTGQNIACTVRVDVVALGLGDEPWAERRDSYFTPAAFAQYRATERTDAFGTVFRFDIPEGRKVTDADLIAVLPDKRSLRKVWAVLSAALPVEPPKATPVSPIKRRRTSSVVNVDGVPSAACIKCNRVLPLSDYYKNKAYTAGRYASCKACMLRAKQERRRRGVP